MRLPWLKDGVKILCDLRMTRQGSTEAKSASICYDMYSAVKQSVFWHAIPQDGALNELPRTSVQFGRWRYCGDSLWYQPYSVSNSACGSGSSFQVQVTVIWGRHQAWGIRRLPAAEGVCIGVKLARLRWIRVQLVNSHALNNYNSTTRRLLLVRNSVSSVFA